MFSPRPVDLDWAKEMVRITQDGGLLGFPYSELIYRMKKETKTLVLVVGNQNQECHKRTLAVFGAIGYTVIIGREPPDGVIDEMLRSSGLKLLDLPGAEWLCRMAHRHELN